jgi:hypothetical protein
MLGGKHRREKPMGAFQGLVWGGPIGLLAGHVEICALLGFLVGAVSDVLGQVGNKGKKAARKP